MKFRRINVDTVRCLISQEELMENGLEVENFLHNDSKAEAFLRKIITMAEEEVGYKVRGGNISIQVSVLPKNIVALTFSEKPDANIMNVLENLKTAVENLSKNVDAANKTIETSGQQPVSRVDHSECQIMFSSLDKIERYSKAVQLEMPVESSIYKLDHLRTYFLLLKKAPMNDKQYCRLLSTALEFSESIYANAGVQAYILEHGSCIIDEGAIQVMQML